MRLATRCTACGTTFRVVPDQLRVSDGWVRCGRCDTVFDAWISLAEMDGEGSGATQYAGLVDTPLPPPPAAVAPADEDAPVPAPEPGVDIYATLLVSDESGVPEEWLTHPPSNVEVARAVPVPAGEGSGESVAAEIPEAGPADATDDVIADATTEATVVTTDATMDATTDDIDLSATRVPDTDSEVLAHADADTDAGAEFSTAPEPAQVAVTAERSVDDDSGLHLLDLQEPPLEAPAPIEAHEAVVPPPGFVISDYAQDPMLDVEESVASVAAEASIVDVRDDELHAIPSDAPAETWTAAAPARAAAPVAGAGEARAWDDVEDANNLLPRWNIPDDPSEIVAPTTTSGALTTVPGFVLDADRRARWQHPAVRAVLALVALGLLATLVLQAAIQWRDDLVADHPDLRASLERVCQTAGCTISAPRRIDELVVDSSGLAKLTGSGSDEAYRLSLVLRSRSSVDVAMPAFELTLSDAQGTVVARRVLKAHELNAPRVTVPSGAELPMQVTLTTPGHAVVGYTVEIFYP